MTYAELEALAAGRYGGLIALIQTKGAAQQAALSF
jgi:hypothetical protein